MMGSAQTEHLGAYCLEGPKAEVAVRMGVHGTPAARGHREMRWQLGGNGADFFAYLGPYL